MTATERETAINNAFDTWENSTVLTFTQVYNPSNADLKILWSNDSIYGGTQIFWSNTLAYAFFPPTTGGVNAGHMIINDTKTFYVNGTTPDLESTVLHEIGHLIGLNHSIGNSNAVMYKYVFLRRNLHIEDCMGAWDLYGCPFGISGSDLVTSSNTYSINWTFPSSITITWSINNSNFSLTPSGNQCSVSCSGNTNEEATLTATITLNGQSVSIQKNIVYVGAIDGNSFVDSQTTYQIPSLSNDFSVTWGVSDNSFVLSPSSNQCNVTSNQNNQYKEATLSAYIRKNGLLLKTLSKQIFHIGNIVIKSINSSQAVYELKNLPQSYTTSWSVNNNAFTLTPSGNQCASTMPNSYQHGTLTAAVSKNGQPLKSFTKSILSQETSLEVDGIQYEYTSSSGMYPEQTFNISASNAVNGYSSSSIAVNGDCDITLVSDRFKGMNISFEGNSSLLPTDVYYDDDWVDFHLEESSTPYTLVMRAQSDGGYYNFNLNFTVSPFPELYQMYYDDDPELVVNLSGNALSIFLSNAIGSELGGGLIQQSTWYLRIYRAQTGAQVYSQTVNGPSTNVYVNNYVNGLYIVTAIYNGNTYHAKVYVNH